MSIQDEKIENWSEDVLAQRRIVLEAQAELRSAKELLSRKRKVYEEENEKLGYLIDELEQLKNGQPHLPFKDHPDVVTGGTPALLHVAGNLASDKLKTSKSGNSLKSNLSILIGYGLSQNLVDSVMNSDLNISTVQQLCDAMNADPAWHKKVQGLGAKKVVKLKEALQKYLDGGSEPSTSEDEAPDNRLKKCGNIMCGAFRSPDQERCPQCNDSTFELANPPSDTEGDSTLPSEFVENHYVPTEDGAADVTIHTVQDPDSGLWYSSYSIDIEDQATIGREVPHHSSTPHETSVLAIESACVEAGNKLMELEMDSEAASVREFSQNLDTGSDSEEGHSDIESEDHTQDLDSPVSV